jgi:hypothetical protein
MMTFEFRLDCAKPAAGAVAPTTIVARNADASALIVRVRCPRCPMRYRFPVAG